MIHNFPHSIPGFRGSEVSEIRKRAHEFMSRVMVLFVMLLVDTFIIDQR